MRVSPVIGLALAASLLLTRPASAGNLVEESKKIMPDSDVQKLLELALKNIHTGPCGENGLCAPVTPEELAHPPISIDEARKIIMQGAVTALVQYCGLDFRRTFLPMRSYYRNQQKLNERTLAVIARLHGISQGMQLPAYKKKWKTCPEEMRTGLDAKLPNLPR